MYELTFYKTLRIFKNIQWKGNIYTGDLYGF